jgi:hypothetical protein
MQKYIGGNNMRSEYDMIEDVRIKKTSGIFNRSFLIKLIAVLIFAVSCGIFFNTTYLFAMQKIEIQDKKEDELNKDKLNSSRKAYMVEMKLREDVKKIMNATK